MALRDSARMPVFMADMFTDQWRTVQAEADVPEGATKLARIRFYRRASLHVRTSPP